MNTYYIATNDDGKKVVYTVGFGSFGALGDGEGQDSSDPVSLNLTGDLETLEFKSVSGIITSLILLIARYLQVDRVALQSVKITEQ